MPDSDYWTPLLLSAPFLLLAALVHTSGTIEAAAAPTQTELSVVVVDGGWAVHRDTPGLPGQLSGRSTQVTAVGPGDGGALRRAARDLLGGRRAARVLLTGAGGVTADRVAWTADQLDALAPGRIVVGMPAG